MRRIRAVLPSFPRILLLLLGPAALTSGNAAAAPIHYETQGMVSQTPGQPSIHFEGTQGTLDSGSTSSLGKFFIDPPTAGKDATYNQVPFAIEVRAPDLDRTIPPTSPGG